MTRYNTTISNDRAFINRYIVAYKAILTYDNFIVFWFFIIIRNQMKIFIKNLNSPRNHAPFSDTEPRIGYNICLRTYIAII
ncbi:hypothetical protein HMPREF3142_02210 [Klebsiella sp. HMSC16C06]|nr:hypothetical protein HMPREF3142_02210 [Klebsiella sp. HMSC16C06]